MQLQILGASGGIGPDCKTTSFLINDDTLIDAGTGLDCLSFDTMLNIKQVFLTHSHLDHISHLPFLLNFRVSSNLPPLKVYGLKHTIDALKNHIFNNCIWPDFTKIPSVDAPCLTLHTLTEEGFIPFPNGVLFPLPANHAVPTIGYWVGKDEHTGCFAFTGDSTSTPALWQTLNQLPQVRDILVDNQYLESEVTVSQAAKHFYPSALSKDLAGLNDHPNIYITHLPPQREELIFAECKKALDGWKTFKLERNQIFNY